MGDRREQRAQQGPSADPHGADPVQELKDAATSARLLKARIEDAQKIERAPVLRDPSHRAAERHDEYAAKDHHHVRKAG